MPPLAFALVAASVVCHATWNLLSKKAAVGGTAFVAVWSVVASLIWAPFGVWALVIGWDSLGPGALVLVGGAALLHTGYYLLLQRGYAVGDLSVVYPIARGLGPVLVCAVAVPFFGEDPGLLGWAGTLALSVSVAFIGRPDADALRRRGPVLYALAVGVFIAAYTLWDRNAVTTAALSPILVNWGGDVGRTLLLTPWLLRHRTRARQVWREHRREVFGTALCSPGAYMLALTAMTMAPVTVVAPLREVSVLLVVFLGARVLGEQDMWKRLAAALGVVAGAVGVTMGRG
ncbi:EamA family transporter [Catellatospora tritici]|uniref:EamA family transporter n=1 Tax=Catellatospora tritici TaxID=2851566 RepID=UPI001C2D2E12|nr:EamA family transporter [Catellatospora tritici]MBV1851648.1 EamA family transporter [Catellatospora tritici]